MKKILIGRVSSAKADKTITISVVSKKTHALYRKQYSVTSKYMAHDENNECKVGDKVSIEETRPLSAKKRHVLKEILERAALTQKDLSAMEADEPKVEVKEVKKEVKAEPKPEKKPTPKTTKKEKETKEEEE